jgi:trimethylamine--corrinoid protein Co-methyltransferase
MAAVTLSLLSAAELRQIQDAAWSLLCEVGLAVLHAGAREALASIGCPVEGTRVRFPEVAVRQALAQAPRQFSVHGRDPAQTVSFGSGAGRLMASPGQRYALDLHTGERREPTLADAQAAIRLGDALPNIAIVGALAEPAEIELELRPVRLAAELVKGSTKPGCVFVPSRAAAKRVLDVYAAAAGGESALRRQPRTLGFLDPVSPLQLPGEGLEIALVFARAGQPLIVASMALSSGTAPATLAGTLALVHAEVLAGITTLQALAPGTPVLYGGIPHVLDPRTSRCSFGSPEQGLMALALIQLARALPLPVYVNTGLTDALGLDAQAGFEKATSQCLGRLGGADLLGHAGICGADEAGSLAALVADDAMMGYLSRVCRGFEIDPETLAAGVTGDVGPGGNFLAEPHTARYFRNELWMPGACWPRQGWEVWSAGGRRSLADRARARALELLATHQVPSLDPGLAAQIDRIAAGAGIRPV